VAAHLGPKQKRGKFLVTGGGGFLGAHLCRRFLAREPDEGGLFASNNEVTCIDNLNNGKGRILDLMKIPGFRVIRPGEFVSEEINYVLHFASYPSPKDHLRMPLETLAADSQWTMEMVKLAHLKNSVFMLASTGHIDQEHDPTNERGIYAEGKRFAEAYTMAFHRQYGTEVRIIRMFNSYGPGMRIDDGRVVPTFIVKALKGELLNIKGGSQMISLTYIDDMLDAIERVLYSDLCLPVEIGSPLRISISDLGRLIINLAKSNSKITTTSQQITDERTPDLELATGLGWSPKISLEEGLQKTIEDLRGKIGI
jgi:dTDP-glucose 4,6-dehydratase